MRYVLGIATLWAVAAVAFGVLAVRATPGDASPVGDGEDRGGAGGALSYRARVVTPAPGHLRALQIAYRRSHGRANARGLKPLRLLEATHLRVLWALATFRLDDGTLVVERFSRRGGQGWRDLGATRARCPAVPPEVRTAWRRTACGVAQTS